MDYKQLKENLVPFFQGDSVDVKTAEEAINNAQPENTFDERMLIVLRNITTSAKVGASLQALGSDILGNSEYFSDKGLRKKEKDERLEQLLSAGNYQENEELFTLSMFRTYLETILNKQLYEINLKIEENQRLLQNMQSWALVKTKKK
ncbi:MAG: hypothetical protein ABIJ85_00460 [bacterium]|nr:hypothetical protein [Nitrospinota bacterium]